MRDPNRADDTRDALGGADAKAPLGIGVTGHRPERLGNADVEAIAHSAEAALRAIATAAGPAAALRLVTSLAEGADAIVTDAALALGWPVDVVLPFHRDEYAADFKAEGVRDEFLARLDRADAVFELPGHRGEPGGGGAAYERAGRLMLAQVDILVAVWDGDAARGRGGAAQIVTEALDAGIPVIHLDPGGAHPPRLLWDGLDRREFAQHRLIAVPRGSLADLPRVVEELGEPSVAASQASTMTRRPRMNFGLAYPLLLAISGVRALRLADLIAVQRTGAIADLLGACIDNHARSRFGERLETCLAPAYARADASATRLAQLFRSAYVGNFALAALAVVVSLLGLALPSAAKPYLVSAEFIMLSRILVVTRLGNRRDWHRRWLDSRRFAERLRILAVSSQLGDLGLRDTVGGGNIAADPASRTISRMLGLPSALVDDLYLERVRDDLVGMITGQIAYLQSDGSRMHRLEHRLHLLGTLLFGLSAILCATLLLVQAIDALAPHGGFHLSHGIVIAITIASAALPAIGAAIYGIRMQGDFAGVAERSRSLSQQLLELRTFILEETPSFDMLWKQSRVAARLLTEDVSRWHHALRARPLALPG
jgi:hypothetical protein